MNRPMRWYLYFCLVIALALIVAAVVGFIVDLITGSSIGPFIFFLGMLMVIAFAVVGILIRVVRVAVRFP